MLMKIKVRHMYPVLSVAILLIVAAGLGAQQPRLLVNTSHTGQVDALAYSETHQIIVSAGSNGSIRIWDSQNRDPLRSMQVSHFPVESIAIHPVQTRLAVLTRTSGGFRLSVWDWSEFTEVYARDLGSRPLSFGFSPQGTWLVYTRTDFPSVVTLNTSNWEAEEIVGSQTGIAGYFTIGASEANIMTYAPSNGRIVYTSLSDGRTLQTATSVSGLQRLRVLQNRRFSVAQRGNQLIVIDIVTGSLVTSRDHSEIRDISVDQRTGDILVLSGTMGSRRITRYHFSGNTLSLGEEIHGDDIRDSASAISIGGQILTGGPDGRLATLDDGAMAMFAENVLRPIRSVQLATNRMLVSADAFGTNVFSDFFRGSRVIRSAERVSEYQTSHSGGTNGVQDGSISVTEPDGSVAQIAGPFGRHGDRIFERAVTLQEARPELSLLRTSRFDDPVPPRPVSSIGVARSIEVTELLDEPWAGSPERNGSLVPLLDGDFLLWGSSEGLLQRLNVDGTLEPVPSPRDNDDQVSVNQVTTTDRGITVLYSDGVIEERHPVSLQVMQSRRVQNAWTAVFARENLLLVGRNAAGTTTSPLVRVDPRTGESVPISSRLFLAFRAVADPRRGAVYVLGLERYQGATVTSVERLSGVNLGTSETVVRLPVEDIEADLAVDPLTGAVYVAAGFDGIAVWDGGDVRFLPMTVHLPRRITIGQQKILSVNANGTVSIWDQVTEQLLADVYLFDDRRWLALGADGGFFAADGVEVEDLLRFADPESRESIADARISLPLTAPRYGAEIQSEFESVLRTLGPRN